MKKAGSVILLRGIFSGFIWALLKLSYRHAKWESVKGTSLFINRERSTAIIVVEGARYVTSRRSLASLVPGGVAFPFMFIHFTDTFRGAVRLASSWGRCPWRVSMKK